MNHDLKHCKPTTLIMKAETLDARLRREERSPLPAERDQYELIVAELVRRNEYKVLPYYQERLSRVYRPSPRCAYAGRAPPSSIPSKDL
jgi:hypothetical protein